jgi:beta-xylosidase
MNPAALFRRSLAGAAGLLLTTPLLAQIAGGPGNPLFDGADPDITIAQGQYWIYPTNEGGPHPGGGGPRFYTYSSPDLQVWTRHGPVLSFKDVPWIDADGQKRHGAWAPGIFQENGRFYLYYAVGPQAVTPSRIGVAVSDKPDGPFVDSGKPLVTGGNGFEAIDPMVFADAVSGKTYLYCGGSAGATLHVYELNPDLVSIARQVPVDNPRNFTEGVYMTKRNGVYYLSYSHGSYRDASYSVHYCTAPTALGPWTYRGPILVSAGPFVGPGHHAFFQNPGTGQWYIVYHRWNNVVNGQMPRARSVCIDKVQFAADGSIEPVVMTTTGVAPAPLGPQAGPVSRP